MGPEPAPQDARAFIASLDEVDLARFRVVGAYTRYDEAVRNALQDARQKILAGFEPRGQKRENHLVWAAPGTGKTYFVQQVATSLPDGIRYHEVNLAGCTESEFRAALRRLDGNDACLCLVDEVDAKPQEPWPYEVLLPYLDAAVERGARFVFVLAGSSGASLEEIKQRIAARPKGTDLLSRIPAGHEHVIGPMSLGDRLLIVLSQLRQAGAETGREIRAIEKLGLYYVALKPRLANARQLREFAVRAVERVPKSDDRVKYDHLFNPGDPENKAFWLEAQAVARDLADKFVTLTRDDAGRYRIPPTAAGLPAGTVTLLFTDIERSTEILQRLGDRRYAEILAEHRRVLVDAFTKGNGREVDTQGDAFFVAFARARDAVATAVAAQEALIKHRWPEGASLQVRMGLHTGEPLSDTERYVGLDVHRAARICAAGHGRQVLLSDAVRGLAARDLPPAVSLRDLGFHRLKDLREPEHLFQVEHPDLPAEFPPLKSLSVLPNNLPIQLTSFVGRDREIAEVKGLLPSTRLLTLTGAGGAGKTRLGLQVATEVLDSFPDGVWVVELAALADPALVPQALASVLSVSEHPGRPLTETLVGALRHKSMLIVLDNCEHLQSACVQFVNALLLGCHHVHVLVTSRIALGIPGETLWRVPSLSVPDPGHPPAPADLQQYEAVRLFVERARASQRQFALTVGNAPAVAQVCRELDGIPLALELAAARTRVLTVDQIATRLSDRFQLLTGGSSVVVPHQQTLRAAMDWSYDLLSEKERTLLRRLSVFAGGCTLEAAESVCADGDPGNAEVLDLLTQLVDKSLVQVEVRAGEARYSLLETVRQYGRHRLEEAGDAPGARRRHLDWYLTLAERAVPEMTGPNQLAWLERLEQNHDNLRAALEWSLAGADTAPALRLAAALHGFWDIHNHFAEGRAWLDRVLSMTGAVAPAPRAKALVAAAHLAHRQGDYTHVTAWCDEALALAEQTADKSGSAEALHYLAHAAEATGNFVKAGELLEHAVALHRAGASTWKLARTMNCLANTARAGGEYPRATALYEEALTLLRAHGEQDQSGQTLHNLSYAVLRQGDHERSRALFRQALTAAEERGNRRMVLKCLAGLAAASAEANPRWAAKLFGAAEALLTAAHYSLEIHNRRDIDDYAAVARGRLGEDAFKAAWAEGAAMTLEQAVAYCLSNKDHA
jgi:predicted ATPase/class 3 adenylate cyclase